MIKSFKAYLQESEKSFGFCIKTVETVDDAFMERLERLLLPYNLVNISSPKKVEKGSGLEFQTLQNKQVTHIDCTLGVPVSSYVLLQELKTGLNIPEDFLIVRAANEPLEILDTGRKLMRDLDLKAKEKGLTQKASLLSTDSNYLDAEQPLVKDVYGNKYNKRFLEFLADVAANRTSREVEAPSSHISLEDLKKVKREPTQDVADFNDQYDTPKPVSANKGNKNPPVDSEFLGEPGNFDNEVQRKFKLSKDKKSKLVVDTAENTPIKKARK